MIDPEKYSQSQYLHNNHPTLSCQFVGGNVQQIFKYFNENCKLSFLIIYTYSFYLILIGGNINHKNAVEVVNATLSLYL